MRRPGGAAGQPDPDRCIGPGERIAQGGAALSAPDNGHQAQGLDVDELAAAVEIEKSVGPVLASLPRFRIAAGVPARWPCAPFATLSSVRFWRIVLKKSVLPAA